MKLKASELDFPSTQGEFRSPFFSEAAYGSSRFNALLKGEAAGVIASQGAEAWQSALTRATKSILTSNMTGGMPVNIINDILWTDEGNIGQEQLAGLFATAVFPASTKKQAMLGAAAEVGLNVAVDAISAVPIAGPVFKAAINVGIALSKIFSQSDETISRTVPWQEYSKGTDEDIVNSYIIKIITPSVDWTRFFEPPMPPGPFWVVPAKGGPEGAWAAGVFKEKGAALYEPDYTDGLGYMPGTQRMVEVLQMARVVDQPSYIRDAVTNVGEFYPSSSQWGSVAWGMVEASANDGTGADMYKVQASQLIGKWHDYWGAYFEDIILTYFGSKQYNLGNLYARKAIAKFLTFKSGGMVKFVDADNLATWGDWLINNLTADVFKKSNTFSPGRQFYRPDNSLTTPALERLRRRQLSALSNSVACAYVRPRKVGNRPAFAAFRDPGPATKSGYSNFGEQLRAECDRVREILLTHPARWKVSYNDVKAVDPQYAQLIKESQQGIPPLNLTLVTDPITPDADPGPPPEEPNGGTPFEEFVAPTRPDRPKGGWSTSKKIFVGAAITGAGYLGYKAYKGELGEVKDAVRKIIPKKR